MARAMLSHFHCNGIVTLVLFLAGLFYLPLYMGARGSSIQKKIYKILKLNATDSLSQA